MNKSYDAIVIGGGHAGVEAALALARTSLRTLMMTLTPDAIAYMACNPAIGGTAKGHLVREIDALGGQMGVNADATYLQMRMLNRGKGEAVHSLRAQSDKIKYHLTMKRTLEEQENLDILQAEAAEILTENGAVRGVKTTLGDTYLAKAVVVATGVYLNSDIITGEWRKESGPSGFANATHLTKSLMDLGLEVRRFKTGTPARLDGRTIDYSVMQAQEGEDVYPFSFMTEEKVVNTAKCYLTYTTQATKDVIMANISRSPLYNGTIRSTGPRYCPSIEDKVVRFADKERHQIFIEPESAFTHEVYAQGMSSSLPFDVQEQMYHTVTGLEKARIVRYAYAIEYDCIDSTRLLPTLQVKGIEGLYTAGQINGSSGYEEAAAQGLIAGINASLRLREKAPLVLRRDEAYIGVLIDDLVTKGTNEPYRMMTARAEHRLHLRQENADMRLTPKGIEAGLVDDKRREKFEKKKAEAERFLPLLKKYPSRELSAAFLKSIGEGGEGTYSYGQLFKRTGAGAEKAKEFFPEWKDCDTRVLGELITSCRYEGYLEKQKAAIEREKKMEDRLITPDIDYLNMHGLRLEARQKLDKIRPLNLGQAARISGVSPADITVLMVRLSGRSE